MFNFSRVNKWILVFTLCIMPTSLLYGMDELEKAYKEQLERYNSQISLNKSFLKITEESSLEYLRIATEVLAHGGKRVSNKAMSKYFQSERKVEELQGKINETSNKRQDLKIKVLEKYGKLPDWWIEPDKQN